MANPKFIDGHQSWLLNFLEHLRLEHSQQSLVWRIILLTPLLLGLSILRWAVKFLRKYSSQNDYGMAISYSLRKSEFGLLMAYIFRLQRPDTMTFGSHRQRKRQALEYGQQRFGFLGKFLKVKEVKMVFDEPGNTVFWTKMNDPHHWNQGPFDGR